MKAGNFFIVGPSSENGPMCIICAAFPSSNGSNRTKGKELCL